MASPIDIHQIVNAFGRLLRFQASFAETFQATRALAQRSFLVMAPAFILFVIGQFVALDVRSGIGPTAVGTSLLGTFLVNWLLLPLLIAGIGWFWNRRQEALNALYFYNFWGFSVSLLSTVIMLVLMFAPSHLQDGAALACMLFFVVYEIYALRTLLRIDGAWVLLIVALDFGVSASLQQKVTEVILCVPLA